ncbi:MAG: hypothetical protein DWQ01_12810 [Planctomycetota bacterium]|nr:MAG: hypothetical protein DWQ01_12810 [Planctomycetota bacterium]
MGFLKTLIGKLLGQDSKEASRDEVLTGTVASAPASSQMPPPSSNFPPPAPSAPSEPVAVEPPSPVEAPPSAEVILTGPLSADPVPPKAASGQPAEAAVQTEPPPPSTSLEAQLWRTLDALQDAKDPGAYGMLAAKAKEDVAGWLEAGLKVRTVDVHGNTPIHRICHPSPNSPRLYEQGVVPILELLIERGAELEAPFHDPAPGAESLEAWSALQLAVNGGRLLFVERLLQAGADLEYRNPNGQTAFDLSLAEYHPRLDKPKLKIFWKLAEASQSGRAWLQSEVGQEAQRFYQQQAGEAFPANFDWQNAELQEASRRMANLKPQELNRLNPQFNPLHQAARFGRADLVAALLDQGADVNARALEGETPLIMALDEAWSAARDVATVELLLAKGADPKLRDQAGHSPLELASRYAANRQALERILINAR